MSESLSREQYRNAAKVFYDHSAGCMPTMRTIEEMAQHLQYTRPPDALAGQLYEALKELVKGISACHYCGAELISEHGASHCEDCPSGCEAHDAPDCPQTADLIEAAHDALRAYEERAK